MSYPSEISLRFEEGKFAGIFLAFHLAEKMEQMLKLEIMQNHLPFKTTKNNPIKCSKFPLADVILIL